MWTVIAGVASVGALALAGMPLILSEKESEIIVVDVSVQRPSKVAADFVNGADDREPPIAGEIDGVLVDITMKNSGEAAAVIMTADVEFLFAEQLDSCEGGGGEAAVSAAYVVRVPADPPATPFTLSRSMRFSIGPGEVERIAFSIGPDWQTDSAPVPWLYAADISLQGDFEGPIHVGVVETVAKAGDGAANLRAAEGNGACVGRNSELLKRLSKIEGTRSSEVELLIAGYARLREAG